MSAAPNYAPNRGERISLVVEIIDLFLDRRTPLPFREVVETLGLDRRTVYRYMQSFEVHGLLERVHEHSTGRGGQAWRRGPRLISMAGRR